MKQGWCRFLNILLVCGLTINLVACASGVASSNIDPYESYNRKVFAFNSFVDKTVFRPVAKTYDFITPDFVQARVTNVFSNLDTAVTIANDFLQFKIAFAVMDMWRLLINSTLGLGGMFDVAGKIGMPQHREDFGLTLAHWGAKNSSYTITPFLGSSTFRDTFGTSFDLVAANYAFWNHIKPGWIEWSAYGLDLVNMRARLLAVDPLVDGAFDPYVFVRDAYLQRRKKQVADNEISFYDLYKDYHKPVAESAEDSVAESEQHAALKHSLVGAGMFPH